MEIGDYCMLSDLLGPKNENTLMREKLRIPNLREGQIHQEVMLI